MIEAHDSTVVLLVDPPAQVPHTLQWSPQHARESTIGRFVRATLEMRPSSGWSSPR